MKNVLSLLALLSLVFLSSCSPSMKITGNWMNKDMMGKGNYKKIFLFVIASDMGAKQSVENAQAKAAAAEGITTVKSYEVFGPNFLAQKPTNEQIMAKIRETGCDAVFTSALVDVKSETRYVPGTTNYAYTEDQTYFIESNLYDVKTEEIVWSVQSEAYNPTNVDNVARTYSALLFEKLRTEGITHPKK